MISQKAASLPSAIRAGCSRHIPASSVALSRTMAMRKGSAVNVNLGHRFLTTSPRQSDPLFIRGHPTYPPLNRRWLSSHPICENIDCNIAKDLSPEEFDSKLSCNTIQVRLYTLHSQLSLPISYRRLQVCLLSAQPSSRTMAANSSDCTEGPPWYS